MSSGRLNIGLNDLKLMLYIEETSLYEILLSFIMKILRFVCSRASNLAKLLQGWPFW